MQKCFSKLENTMKIYTKATLLCHEPVIHCVSSDLSYHTVIQSTIMLHKAASMPQFYSGSHGTVVRIREHSEKGKDAILVLEELKFS